MTRRARLLVVLAAVTAAAAPACSKFGADATDVPENMAPDASSVDASPRVAHRIYVFGGMTAVTMAAPRALPNAISLLVDADGKMGAWTSSASLDVERFAGASAQSGDTLLSFGGVFQAKPYSDTGQHALLARDSSDTAAPWTSTPPLLAGRSYAAAAANGNDVYLSGGKTAADSVSGLIDRYDVRLDTWGKAGALPSSVAGHTTLVHGSRLYVLGGERAGKAGLTAAVASAPFLEDRSVGTFTDNAELPAAVAYQSVAAIGGWLFSIGGVTSAGTTSAVARGTFDDSGALKWDVVAPLSPLPASQKGIAEACVVVIGRTLYLIGGRDGATDAALTTVYTGEVDDNGVLKWSTTLGPPLPEGRAAFGCAVSPSSAP